MAFGSTPAYFGIAGSLMSLSNRVMILSVVIPSACAWKLVLSRCRKTGIAIRLMSSMAILNRPSMAAIAFPAWIKN